MIIGTLENTERVEVLNPHFKRVFDYVKSHDFISVPSGKIEIDGDDVWIVVSDVEGRGNSEAPIETHDQYIDIQMPMSGCETFGWQSRELLKDGCDGGYDSLKDITFYKDKTSFYFTLEPGQFAIFFPEDGHAPCIGEGAFRKVVVKVRV